MAKNPRLNQIIAVCNGKKAQMEKAKTDLYHKLSKADFFNGMIRTYHPFSADNPEKFQPETKHVQTKTQEVIDQVRETITSLIDAVATQDYGNCVAKADITVAGAVLIKDVPVTHLLFLEKQLVDLNTMVEKLPVLDPSKRWTVDENQGLYMTPMVQTLRSKKSPKVITKAPATLQHPAQAELIYEDVPIGNYEVVEYSGAISGVDKAKILDRIHKLQDAVKFAREEANSIEVSQKHIGKSLLDFVFNS